MLSWPQYFQKKAPLDSTFERLIAKLLIVLPIAIVITFEWFKVGNIVVFFSILFLPELLWNFCAFFYPTPHSGAFLKHCDSWNIAYPLSGSRYDLKKWTTKKKSEKFHYLKKCSINAILTLIFKKSRGTKRQWKATAQQMWVNIFSIN